MDTHDRLFVNWDERYSVGVQAIDEQHRFLILKTRELQEAMAAGTAGEMLAPTRTLGTYWRFHCAYEERLYQAGLDGFSLGQRDKDIP